MKTRKLAVSGMLAAVSIVMGMTPLGFLPIGPTKATLMHLPVIIGALLEGPVVGLVVGLIFGLSSLYQAIVAPTVISPLFYDPLVSVLPRLLIGPAAYAVYFGLGKLLGGGRTQVAKASTQEGAPYSYYVYPDKRRLYTVECIRTGFAAVVGTLCNTCGVLGALYLFHGADYAQALGVNPAALGGVILGVAATNGIPEAIIAVVVTIAVVLAVKRVGKQKKKGSPAL